MIHIWVLSVQVRGVDEKAQKEYIFWGVGKKSITERNQMDREEDID
jgi:hypothetical protein